MAQLLLLADVIESYTIAGRVYHIQAAKLGYHTLWCGNQIIGSAIGIEESRRLIHAAAKVLLENELETAQDMLLRAKAALKLLGKNAKNLEQFQTLAKPKEE